MLVIDAFWKHRLRGPFYQYGLSLIPAWISSHAQYEMNYLFIPKLQWRSHWSWEWISNFIPCFTGHMITYPSMLAFKLLHVSKRGPVGWPCHDDVIKWKHFPRYWPFVRGIHRSPVNSPHKGQWRGALIFTLICVWINGWVNNREAVDLRRYRTHYDVTVMVTPGEAVLSADWLICGTGVVQSKQAPSTINIYGI